MDESINLSDLLTSCVRAVILLTVVFPACSKLNGCQQKQLHPWDISAVKQTLLSCWFVCCFVSVMWKPARGKVCKTNLCYVAAAFKTRTLSAGFDFERILCILFSCCTFDFVLNGGCCVWQLCSSGRGVGFKAAHSWHKGQLYPQTCHWGPPCFHLQNHAHAFFHDWINEQLQLAAALCLSLWWHIILMLWLTRVTRARVMSLTFLRRERKEWGT